MVEAAGDFVCAADEVWRLQRGSEADCVFFQEMVTGGERITDRGTRQGTWVVAPGGVVLARVNTRNVEKQLAALAKGLAAWNELAEEQKHLPDDVDFSTAHRYAHFYPEGGLALERIGRDVSVDGFEGSRARRWNRDHAWFSREEIAALVDGPAPQWSLLAERLARFHIVDNVGGQSIPYAPGELTRAELEATVVNSSAEEIVYELSGRTAAESTGEWRLPDGEWKPPSEIAHGIEANFVGRAVWSVSTRRFTAFELVAVGRRWGRTTFNGRSRDVGAGLLAFHFQLATWRLPPTFASAYDAPWITHPEVANWHMSPAECGLPER